MAIYKRPNSKYYWMKFWFNSELVQKSTKMANKKDAEGYEKRIWVKLQNGEMTLADLDKIQEEVRTIITFDDAVTDFLEFAKLKHANKPNTYERIRFSVLPMQGFLGRKKIERITTSDLESYVQKRSGDISQKTKEKITRGTINNELVILKTIFRRLIENKTLKANPVESVKQLKENERQFHVISKDEELFYLMAAPQPLKDIFTLMIEAGFRPKELFSLSRKQVNLDQNYIQVMNGKTESSNRKVYLTNKAAKIVAERLRRFSGNYLFPNREKENNPPVRPDYVNNQHLVVMKPSTMDFRMYDARHTCATRLLEAGCDLLTLAYILGHNDLSTLSRYAHPSEDRKRDAVKRMESAVIKQV